MKIALVNFPILDVGGITTWDEAIKLGYERNGHEVDRFYAKCGRSYSCKPDEKTFIGDKYKRGEILQGEFLSYSTEDVPASVQKLNEYDVIHFIHPSPHPTKSNIAAENPLGWLEFYKQCTAKKIATMHDVNWAKTNLWYILASKYIDVLTASQQPHFPAVLQYPTNAAKFWAYFPIDVEGCKITHKRVDSGMVAHQWIKWKNHHKIIKSLEEFNSCPIDLYGGGQQYHELMKSEDLQKFIGGNSVEDENYGNEKLHRYVGFIAREVLVEEYKKVLFSIDGSTKGYNNYTHFEPMLYGCISMVHEDVLVGEHNTIPADCCVAFNWDNLAEQIEYVRANPDEMKKIRKRALKFIKDNFACEEIAKKMILGLECPQKELNTEELEHLEASLISAMENYGYWCWGTVDEADESYEGTCKECPWLEICTSYVEKNGKREIKSDDEETKPELAKEEQVIRESADTTEICVRGVKVIIDFVNKSIHIQQ